VQTAAVRVVGSLLILFACAAVQLPWFTCHSDCQHACLPVWDLGAHHCHDENAEDHHAHHCLAHCGVQCGQDAGDHADGQEGHGDDHAPGDHQLQFQISRRPVPSSTLSPDTALLAVALVAPVEVPAALPTSYHVARTGSFDTGPPSRLATVRLLL